MKLYEFVQGLLGEPEATCINPKIRFHTSDRHDLEVLSWYLSEDEKTLEIDIGEDGE